MKCFFFLFFSAYCCSLNALTVTSGITPISGPGTQGNTELEMSNGKAIAIWTEGFPSTVEVAYYNGTAWLPAFPLSIGAFPQAGIDGNGNAFAIWLELTTTANQVLTSRFNATSMTWSAPLQLSIGGFNSAPQIAVSSTGNAIAIWVLSQPTIQILASTFNVSTLTWSAPVSVVSGTGSFPSVSVDSQNRGIIMWTDPVAGIEAITVTIP